MSKNKIIILVILLFLVLFLTPMLFMMGYSHLKYNAKISDLELNKDLKIQFMTEYAKGTSGDSQIFEMSTSDLSPKPVKTIKADEWENYSIILWDNAIHEQMGGYDGTTKFENKEIKVNDKWVSEELVLIEGENTIILEKTSNPFSTLGFTDLRWLSDGRHLLIEQNRKLGIYDTITKKYTELTSGMFALEANN